MNSRPAPRAQRVSRRRFLRDATVGAGSVAAASTALEADQSSRQTSAVGSIGPDGPSRHLRLLPPPIRIPDELTAGSNAAVAEIQFPMTGAQVFARACKEEGVAALFCCPGNYGVIHAIAELGIPTYSGRHEGSMTHAADAFIRVTGEIAVASGTEGPGFTDMICGIACANAARTPLLVVASNMALFQEDTEAGIQLAYQQPTTDGMKKYGKRLITPGRVHEYTAYAFRQLRSGVPRPGASRLSGRGRLRPLQGRQRADVTTSTRRKYRTESRPASVAEGDRRRGRDAQGGRAADDRVEQRRLLSPRLGRTEAARREGADSSRRIGRDEGPVSGRLTRSRANARPRRSPARTSSCSSVSTACRRSASSRSVPTRATSASIKSHEDIGRNLPDRSRHRELRESRARSARRCDAADDARGMGRRDRGRAPASSRRRTTSTTRSALELHRRSSPRGHRARSSPTSCIAAAIAKEAVTVASGGYGIARYTRRWLRGYRPGQIMNGAYQYGAIGPDVGYAVGVAAAVQQGVGPQAAYKGTPVVCITGDAGFGYTAMEMETLSKYRLPVIVHRLQQQRVGHLDDGARAESAAAASFPGERALRQGGRGARRARRVRDDAGRSSGPRSSARGRWRSRNAGRR